MINTGESPTIVGDVPTNYVFLFFYGAEKANHSMEYLLVSDGLDPGVEATACWLVLVGVGSW